MILPENESGTSLSVELDEKVPGSSSSKNILLIIKQLPLQSAYSCLFHLSQFEVVRHHPVQERFCWGSPVSNFSIYRKPEKQRMYEYYEIVYYYTVYDVLYFFRQRSTI